MTGTVRIIERHAPEQYTHIECEHCKSLCHSHSGLGCDVPDAPWPCQDVRDAAMAAGLLDKP